MEYNAISGLEKELVRVLKEEYSFYQSFYIIIDKQRDLLKFEKEEKLLDIYTEVEKCRKRILESEEKISAMRKDNPKLFHLAVSAPDVRKLAQSIATLIQKNVDLVRDNESYASSRYNRIKEELDKLRNATKVVKYLNESEVPPQFVDKKN